MFKVKKRALLLIAGIVWLIAGFNVARLGIISYFEIEQQWYWYVLSVVIFLLFGTMFYKMSVKHTKRIMGYSEERQPFWRFFDLKAYIIMAGIYHYGGDDGRRNRSARRGSIPEPICRVFLFGTRIRACAGGYPVYQKFHIVT